MLSLAMQAAMPKEIWLDPRSEEAQKAKGCLTLATVPALGLITNIWQTGQMSIDEVEQVIANMLSIAVGAHEFPFFQCIDLCQEQCLEIHSVVAQALLESNHPPNTS